VGYIKGLAGVDQRSMRHMTSAPQEVLRLQGLNPFGTVVPNPCVSPLGRKVLFSALIGLLFPPKATKATTEKPEQRGTHQ
jgi:hypothetical protein